MYETLATSVAKILNYLPVRGEDKFDQYQNSKLVVLVLSNYTRLSFDRYVRESSIMFSDNFDEYPHNYTILDDLSIMIYYEGHKYFSTNYRLNIELSRIERERDDGILRNTWLGRQLAIYISERDFVL